MYNGHINTESSTMKLLELAAKLKAIYDEHGDIDVMLLDPDRYEPSEVTRAKVVVAEANQWPADWNMPEGFTYVSIES